MHAIGIWKAAAAIGAVCVGFAGCSGSVRNLPVRFEPTCVPCDHPACDIPLDVKYLGSGGFLLRRGGDEIATGPFFSNPSFVKTGLAHIQSDVEAVRRFMPRRPGVSAILIGHAHYDHLMDVPAVVKLKTPHATIYTSESAANSLASIEPALSIETVDSRAWKPGQPQVWIPVPGTQVRVLAISSEHAPHLWGITLMKGSYDKPLTQLPSRGSGWLEGRTHSFLIEFRDANDRPEFRIHYQDSASNGGVGMPPSNLDPGAGGQRPYTIMIPTVASWDKVSAYPTDLIDRLKPDFAVLAHWEDFFLPFTREPGSLRRVRLTDPEPFIDELGRLMGARAFVLPAPLTDVRFARQCP